MSSPPPQEFGQQEEEKQAKDETDQDPDPSPEGDPTTPVKPRPKKKQRLGVHKVDQSKVVDIQSLPANPLLEATFQKQTAVKIKAFVGTRCTWSTQATQMCPSQ